jgi:protein subunit release factor B
MKKRFFLTIAAFFLAVSIMSANVTIRYYNKDSKEHTMKVKIAGSSKTVTFGGSRTATVTIQGGSSECVIETSCGSITVKDGASVEIKNGCITVN